MNKRQKDKSSDETFLFKISDDSMEDAGVHNGDIVIIRKEKEFVSGDIVLAQVNGKLMVKRFISDNNPPFIYLKPENPKYEIIPFTKEVRIKGKIISARKSNFGSIRRNK